MDAYVTRTPPWWWLIWVWITVFVIAAIDYGSSLVVAKGLGLIGFLVCWLAYPIALVFASAVTKAGTGLRIFVAASLAAFCTTLILRPLDNSAVDQQFSAIGMIALLCVQFGAAYALAYGERQSGLRGGVLSAWFFLFFLPVFGMFYIHRRHTALVQHASAA